MVNLITQTFYFMDGQTDNGWDTVDIKWYESHYAPTNKAVGVNLSSKEKSLLFKFYPQEIRNKDPWVQKLQHHRPSFSQPSSWKASEMGPLAHTIGPPSPSSRAPFYLAVPLCRLPQQIQPPFSKAFICPVLQDNFLLMPRLYFNVLPTTYYL